MALSVADLNNAELDTIHLAELVTSNSPTSTDRLAQTKKTWKGIVDELEAEAAITETWQNAQVAETAASVSEAARDASMITADVSTDYNTVFAATAIGAQFTVVYPDGRIVRYKKIDATTSSPQVTYYSASAIANMVNPPVDPATYVMDLLLGRTSGWAVDANEPNVDLAVQVKDPGTPANNFLGPLYTFLTPTTAFPTPKLVAQADGSYKYAPHNDLLRSGDYSVATGTAWAKVAMTPTAGKIGSDGVTADATLLTTTGTSANINQNVTVLAGFYRTHGFEVQAGTSPYMWIETGDTAVTKTVWFKMSDRTVGTVEAGVTHTISSLDENGVPYENAGTFYIAQTRKTVGTSVNIKIGFSETDNSKVTVVGRTGTISRARTHRGVKRLAYLATTTAAARGIPYEYKNGRQRLRIDGASTIRSRSGDDLTVAPWVGGTGLTAALDATGPHGEPSSSLTVTVADGYITQAVTSAGTAQTFYMLARRRTGVGRWYMSNDNGATWKDISADVGVAGGAFKIAYNKSVLANPTIRIRGETLTDVLEVSMAEVAATTHVPPPVPVAAADFTISIDNYRVPITRFPYNAAGTTFYVSGYFTPTAKVSAANRSRIGFVGAGSAMNTIDITTQLTGSIRLEHDTHDGTSRITNIGNLDDTAEGGGQVQIQYSIAPNDYSVAYNGNAAWWSPIPGNIVVTDFYLNFNQTFWLDKMVVVPEHISDRRDDLRKWNLDETEPNVNTRLKASAFQYKFGDDPTVTTSRIPSMEPLYEHGDVAGFISIWGQKHNPGYDVEHPQRMVRMHWEYNRVTKVLASMYPTPGVLLQTAGWATDADGGVQGYLPIKVWDGKWKGRMLVQFMKQDAALGSDARNIYTMLSDDNGYTVGAYTKVLDKFDFIGALSGFLANGENSTYVWVTEGADKGRLYVPLNVNNNSHGVMWTDDFKDTGDGTGTHWSYTPAPGRIAATGNLLEDGITPMGTLSEPSLSVYPDGTLVMLMRNTGSGIVAYTKSTDGGLSFSYPIITKGDNISWNVNTGSLQMDPQGQTGRYGSIMIARATNNGRSGHKIQKITEPTFTLNAANNYEVFPSEIFVGYSPVKKLFDDDKLYVIDAEKNPTSSGNAYESHQLVVFEYE
jgi:hypothetical protein